MWSIKRLRPAAALGAALALTAACASAPPPAGFAKAPLTPLDQYPIKAAPQPERLALAVHPQGVLSPAQEAALAGFAQTWRESGGGAPVVVEQASSGGPDAQLTVQATAGRLVSLGVAPEALRLGAYDAGPDPAGPVVARFDHLVVEAPDCSKGWDNLTSTNSNDVSRHFGCANARNFAVMLADPRDLQGPRPMTPADAGRRAAVLDNYRKGQITGSAKDAQASGAISQRIQ